MQIQYVGPHPEVVVDELDSEQVIIRGKTVDVPDDLAARLLEQNTWSKAKTSAPTPTLASVPTPATADDTTTKASS